ncbi:uncharacterized protein LOC142730027 [Rhinoderma darwinii]|uniref:uncharacterized protein LOC142730027 n=1 Tax=Rhinoderma darwinii TaxID=43563 RepID=UPI003F680DAB
MCDLGRSDEKGPVAVLTLYSFSLARSSRVFSDGVWCIPKKGNAFGGPVRKEPVFAVVVVFFPVTSALIPIWDGVVGIFSVDGIFVVLDEDEERVKEDTEKGMESFQDEGEEQREETAEVIIKMWKNGFTINDGQLRDYTDAANRQFMDSMRKGELPPELHKTFAKKELSVNVEDRKSEHYFIRKKHVDPFSGEGHRLGSATPKVITKANGLEDGGEQSLPSVELKAGEPLTNVKIWLADGKRIVQKCNTTHRMEKDQEMKIVKEDEEIKTEEEKIKIEEENEEETKIEEEKSEEEPRIEEEENAELGNNEEKIKNKDEEEYWDEIWRKKVEETEVYFWPSGYGDDPFWITLEEIPWRKKVEETEVYFWPSEYGDDPFWITIEEIPPSGYGDDPFWITHEEIPWRKKVEETEVYFWPSEFGDYPFWITIEGIPWRKKVEETEVYFWPSEFGDYPFWITIEEMPSGYEDDPFWITHEEIPWRKKVEETEVYFWPSGYGDDPFWITIEEIPPSGYGDDPFWITHEEIPEEDEDEEGVEENLTQIQLEERSAVSSYYSVTEWSEEDEDEEGVEENVTQIQFEEREEDEDEEGVEEMYVETENIEHVKREIETEKAYEYDNIIGMEENEDETKIKQEKKKMNTEKGEMMKVEEDEEEEGMMKVEVDETMDKHETTSRRHKWWLPKSLRGTGTRNINGNSGRAAETRTSR